MNLEIGFWACLTIFYINNAAGYKVISALWIVLAFLFLIVRILSYELA